MTTPTEPGQPGDPTSGAYGAPGGPGAYGTPPAGGGYGAMPPAPEAYGAGPAAAGGMPQLANWGERFLAWLLETALPSIVIAVVFTMLDIRVLANFGPWIYILTLIAWQEGSTGQSWGKKIVGIRLLREQDGQPMGWPMAAVRKIVHILDGICLIGYLWPLWDNKRQTFADKIMKTVVVKA